MLLRFLLFIVFFFLFNVIICIYPYFSIFLSYSTFHKFLKQYKYTLLTF